MLSASVSLTGLHALSWQMTNLASQAITFCPASLASKGMSKRALSAELAARSPRESLGFGTVMPAGGVSAIVMGASAFMCQPFLVAMVSDALAVPPAATLGSVFLIS